MERKIKILYVTAEISPFANAGGLGEVGRSLPKALVATEMVEIHRVMPLYRRINNKLKYVTDFPVKLEEGYETCIIKQGLAGKDIPTYFIQSDRYFFRDNIYSYDDDGIRFFFFCKAVVEMLKRISFQPDIVHMNDWHTGFLPLLLKKEFPGIKTVFTIHNVTYHGFLPASYMKDILSDAELYYLGYPQWLNFMKAAIRYSDLVTTVSPGYAEEIQTPELGGGMCELFKERSNQVVGILNGIDLDSYDPSQDGVLPYPYDLEHMENKRLNRTWLRRYYDLPEFDIPLIAIITRLEYDKGIDIILKALGCADLNSFQLVILGSGNAHYQDILTCISKAYEGRIVVDFNYSFEQAKRIYGAADIYLMPSRYEPCGLGQLYAMRYGAVPIVNPIGGLKDTVKDSGFPESSSGFYMKDWSSEALVQAIEKTIKVYHTPDWIYYVANCMNYDSSWSRSISEYLTYYQKLLSSEGSSLPINNYG